MLQATLIDRMAWGTSGQLPIAEFLSGHLDYRSFGLKEVQLAALRSDYESMEVRTKITNQGKEAYQSYLRYEVLIQTDYKADV